MRVLRVDFSYHVLARQRNQAGSVKANDPTGENSATLVTAGSRAVERADNRRVFSSLLRVERNVVKFRQRHRSQPQALVAWLRTREVLQGVVELLRDPGIHGTRTLRSAHNASLPARSSPSPPVSQARCAHRMPHSKAGLA